MIYSIVEETERQKWTIPWRRVVLYVAETPSTVSKCRASTGAGVIADPSASLRPLAPEIAAGSRKEPFPL